MNDLSATIPAGQLPAAMRNLLYLDKPNSRVTDPINPDLVYLPCDPQDGCEKEVRGEHRQYILLSEHERAAMRWLEGYSVEAVVSCSFHFMDVTNLIFRTGHLQDGRVQLTRRDDGDFDLLITNLNSSRARDFTNFPVELREKMDPIIEDFLADLGKRFREDQNQVKMFDLTAEMLSKLDPQLREQLIYKLCLSGVKADLENLNSHAPDLKMDLGEMERLWTVLALRDLVYKVDRALIKLNAERVVLPLPV